MRGYAVLAGIGLAAAIMGIGATIEVGRVLVLAASSVGNQPIAGGFTPLHILALLIVLAVAKKWLASVPDRLRERARQVGRRLATTGLIVALAAVYLFA